jgi:streptogramin lyase
VPSLNPSLLLRLDADTGEERARVRLPASPVAEAAVGAADGRAYILVEPSEPRIAVVEGNTVDEIPAPDGAVAVRAGYGSLWVPTTNHTVERLVLRTGKWSTIAAGPSPRFLDVGFGAVWVMDQGDGSVTRIDARSGQTEQIAVTGLRIGGGDLTVGGGSVWLRTDSQVARIDPRTRAVTHVIDLPPGSGSAAAVDGFLLITNHDHDAVHVVPLPLPE